MASLSWEWVRDCCVLKEDAFCQCVSNRIRVLILRHSWPTSSSLCLSVAEHRLQQCSSAPNSAAALRLLHDYAIWAATEASPPAEGALLFTPQSPVVALNVLNMRCTSQAVELLTKIGLLIVFACYFNPLFSTLPKGGVVFWPRVLGSKCQPVWSRGLHHSKSRRTLPLLEPLQRWQEMMLLVLISFPYLMILTDQPSTKTYFLVISVPFL